MPGKPIRKVTALPQLLLLLASFALSIGVIECVFRWSQRLHPELSVDVIAAEQRAPGNADPADAYAALEKMSRNAFLEPRIEPAVYADGTTRILFLGDSFTQGAGIENKEDRFSNVLEHRFNDEFERAGSPRRIDIFNAGVGGTNPTHWSEYFDRIAPRYAPDLVFAIFFLRDGAPVPTSILENEKEIEPIREKYRKMPGYAWSAALRFFYNRLAWRAYSEQYVRKITAGYVGTKQQTAVWRKRRAHLTRLADACRAMGIEFHLVIFPMLVDLDDYAFSAIEAEIVRFARANSIPVFSLTPGFLGEDDRSLWISPTNQHPNVEGNRIAADTLEPYLRDAIQRAAGGSSPPQPGRH